MIVSNDNAATSIKNCADTELTHDDVVSDNNLNDNFNGNEVDLNENAIWNQNLNKIDSKTTRKNSNDTNICESKCLCNHRKIGNNNKNALSTDVNKCELHKHIFKIFVKKCVDYGIVKDLDDNARSKLDEICDNYQTLARKFVQWKQLNENQMNKDIKLNINDIFCRAFEECFQTHYNQNSKVFNEQESRASKFSLLDCKYMTIEEEVEWLSKMNWNKNPQYKNLFNCHLCGPLVAVEGTSQPWFECLTSVKKHELSTENKAQLEAALLQKDLVFMKDRPVIIIQNDSNCSNDYIIEAMAHFYTNDMDPLVMSTLQEFMHSGEMKLASLYSEPNASISSIIDWSRERAASARRLIMIIPFLSGCDENGSIHWRYHTSANEKELQKICNEKNNISVQSLANIDPLYCNIVNLISNPDNFQNGITKHALIEKNSFHRKIIPHNIVIQYRFVFANANQVCILETINKQSDTF